jgi:hypothetical protein
MSVLAPPKTESDAIAQGYKPVPDIDAFTQKHLGMTLHSFTARNAGATAQSGMVDCADPNNMGKLCRNQTMSDGTVWIGYCQGDGNCKSYYK